MATHYTYAIYRHGDPEAGPLEKGVIDIDGEPPHPGIVGINALGKILKDRATGRIIRVEFDPGLAARNGTAMRAWITGNLTDLLAYQQGQGAADRGDA